MLKFQPTTHGSKGSKKFFKKKPQLLWDKFTVWEFTSLQLGLKDTAAGCLRLYLDKIVLSLGLNLLYV